MVTREEKEEIVSAYPWVKIKGEKVRVAIRGLRLQYPEIVYKGVGYPLSWELAKRIALTGESANFIC